MITHGEILPNEFEATFFFFPVWGVRAYARLVPQSRGERVPPILRKLRRVVEFGIELRPSHLNEGYTITRATRRGHEFEAT